MNVYCELQDLSEGDAQALCMENDLVKDNVLWLSIKSKGETTMICVSTDELKLAIRKLTAR